MLSELSIKSTVAPAALLSLAALPPLKNGRVNAITIRRIARQRSSISNTFLQPFLAYTTKDAWTYTINTESTYDWKAEQWSVPINAVVSKLTKFGKQPVSLGLGVRYWADSPDSGPHGWGVRFVVTFLFPK